jgi:hypothetical protein
MTATLAEVREAIKERLQTVSGLDTVYGYHNGSPSPPCAIVGWPEFLVLGTRLGDTAAWEATIPVQILVSTADSSAADVRLGQFCDPSGSSSIQETFDLDPTLGGVITGFAVVQGFTQFGIAQFAEAGIQYLSGIVNIEVQST